MSKIILHVELYMNGKWNHFSYRTIKNPNKDLWALVYKNSDVLRRAYSDITAMFAEVIKPECPLRHINSGNLTKLREKIGSSAFDADFGYFPFDDITVFVEPQDKNELFMETGITDARVIAYEVK